MLINIELLELLRIKNPLSSVVSKYSEIENTGCKCPFCHSKTLSFNILPNDIYTCFNCGESGDVLKFISKIENLSFADTVRKTAELSGLYTLEQLKEKDHFRFWDRFMLLCEFFHVSASVLLKEIDLNLSREYILSLKYCKAKPDTKQIELALCRKFGICQDFWNADPDNIMSCLVGRKEIS